MMKIRMKWNGMGCSSSLSVAYSFQPIGRELPASLWGGGRGRTSRSQPRIDQSGATCQSIDPSTSHHIMLYYITSYHNISCHATSSCPGVVIN